VQANRRFFDERFQLRADRAYPLVRDYLKAVREVMHSVWGDNERYMFTRDVTLKALLRVFGDLVRNRKLVQGWEESRDPGAFVGAMRPWADLTREFRAEGFYERFPAKGQVERVRRIHLRLSQSLKQA
jgi:hypothetical protein